MSADRKRVKLGRISAKDLARLEVLHLYDPDRLT